MRAPHDAARFLADTAGVRLLEEVAVLRVTGDDARSWLNGQITNDVHAPRPSQATYALVVNLKGRVVAELWVLDRGPTLDLVVPSALRSSLRAHFDAHIIMEDVSLDTPDDRVITVQGPAAPAVVGAAGLGDGIEAFPCDRLGTGGVDLLVPATATGAARDRLIAAARAVGGGAVDGEAWELARLRRGVPRFGVDFGDDTMPQEAGLGARAVSFDKGCYTGQEAVVMLEHRGRPPKRLARLTVDGRVPPSPRTPLLSADGTDVGFITSATADPEAGGVIALGYLRRGASADAGLATVDGTAVSVGEFVT